MTNSQIAGAALLGAVGIALRLLTERDREHSQARERVIEAQRAVIARQRPALETMADLIAAQAAEIARLTYLQHSGPAIMAVPVPGEVPTGHPPPIELFSLFNAN